MKVLFAVSNEEISEAIVKKYQREYKQIISYKNVYYFNAILKELQKDKSYDRIVISEDLEAFTHSQYDQIDKFIFDKLDSISDEASNTRGNDIPIILICSDRRTKSEDMLVKLFGIGVYNAIIGNDRSVDEVCRLINRPRVKKEAKAYYKIDTEEVKYKAENENDVSEMEIQNIVAHYKRLGKNEDRYIDSFNNIAAQYNDTQLRIISKFLPLNVRAVLEEKSPKYQQVMSFNNSVSDKLRKNKNEKEEENGPSQVLLKLKNRDTIITKPVVIPSAVNMSGTKKLAKHKSNIEPEEEPEVQVIPENIEENTPIVAAEPVKKGRGRPRKNPIPATTSDVTQVKRGRGRPKKNTVIEPEEPEIENDGMQPEENMLPGIDEQPEPVVQQPEPQYDEPEPIFQQPKPQYDEPEPIFQQPEPQYVPEPQFQQPEPQYKTEIASTDEIDLSSLLTPDKKIVTFVGTSKNGTSFIVNNIAELMSSIGINTAILDTTQNRNSYYIYTKNEEELREIATHSIEGLAKGEAKGVKVNQNLTVYTSLPNENDYIYQVGPILETLIKNYSLILIDTDFETPTDYFKESQETYLVQTMDILTIQPLTAFLKELKMKNILDERKLRIVLNKVVKIRGIKDSTIIGGMAFYNDPSMSFMTELFDRDRIKYVTIPFEEETYDISYYNINT